MNKNIPRTKIFISLISLAITFFVWQQGLRDSLNRPSVSFDISQKEKEISELAINSIPRNFKNFFIPKDPINEINFALSNTSFDALTERNKLIFLVSSDSNKFEVDQKLENKFKNKEYIFLVEELKNQSKDNSYKAIVIVKAKEGILAQYIQANIETFKKMVRIFLQLYQA